MPYKIVLETKISLSPVRNMNTQGYLFMRKLPQFNLVTWISFCLQQLWNCSYGTILMVPESEYLHLRFGGWENGRRFSGMYALISDR